MNLVCRSLWFVVLNVYPLAFLTSFILVSAFINSHLDFYSNLTSILGSKLFLIPNHPTTRPIFVLCNHVTPLTRNPKWLLSITHLNFSASCSKSSKWSHQIFLRLFYTCLLLTSPSFQLNSLILPIKITLILHSYLCS